MVELVLCILIRPFIFILLLTLAWWGAICLKPLIPPGRLRTRLYRPFDLIPQRIPVEPPPQPADRSI